MMKNGFHATGFYGSYEGAIRSLVKFDERLKRMPGLHFSVTIPGARKYERKIIHVRVRGVVFASGALVFKVKRKRADGRMVTVPKTHTNLLDAAVREYCMRVYWWLELGTDPVKGWAYDSDHWTMNACTDPRTRAVQRTRHDAYTNDGHLKQLWAARSRFEKREKLEVDLADVARSYPRIGLVHVPEEDKRDPYRFDHWSKDRAAARWFKACSVAFYGDERGRAVPNWATRLVKSIEHNEACRVTREDRFEREWESKREVVERIAKRDERDAAQAYWGDLWEVMQ